MLDILARLLEPKAMSAVLICLFGVYALHVLIHSEGNGLEWWHLVATKGQDGKYYFDLDKFGKLVGIVVGSWAVVVLAQQGKLDALIFGAYLAFVGSIAGYSAYLRSRAPSPPEVPK